MPASLISQLTTDELAAILHHELAHIRRWDPIVQVLQKTVEALLFFHPVTWLLSRRIRIEREKCCDDIAARDTGQLPYAAALLRMAELCVGNDSKRSAALANLAADGNNSTEFASRIRRLMGADDVTSFGLSRRGMYSLIAIVLLASVSFAAVANGIGTQDKDEVDFRINNVMSTSMDTPAAALQIPIDKTVAVRGSVFNVDGSPAANAEVWAAAVFSDPPMRERVMTNSAGEFALQLTPGPRLVPWCLPWIQRCESRGRLGLD